jgi:hypothetical protein
MTGPLKYGAMSAAAAGMTSAPKAKALRSSLFIASPIEPCDPLSGSHG